jgi:putative nucleotidyltransferase with HDIG domain
MSADRAGAGPAEQPGAVHAEEGLCKLPVFRAVALKVMKLTSNEESSISEISNLLEADPGLSAEIVALANSPLCGCRNPIHTVRRAIAQLGFERTKSLTVTAALRSFARGGQNTAAMARAWRHSFSCAVLAEELAPVFDISRNAAYTAGLLHDIGRLGLLAAYPARYGSLADTDYEDLAAILQVETQLMGVDHCQAGMLLSRTWGFPEELQQVAGRHHSATSGNRRDLISLIRSACLMANVLGFGAVSRRELPAVEEIIADIPGRCEKYSNTTAEEIQSWVCTRLASFDLT